MPYPREIALAKFRVTMVIICGLCILSVLVYLLTGGSLLTAKVTLYLYIPDSTGVGQGSPVRVNGIDVGKVQLVQLSGSNDPNRVVRVVMTVETHQLRAIPVDSGVEISSDNLLGDKFIDISSGKRNEYIQSEGELRFQPATDLMKNLDLTQFEQQLRLVDAVLTDIEQGKSRLGKFIVAETMYSDLLRRTAELHSGIRRATATTGQVGSLLYSDALYRQIAAPLRQLDDALSSAQAGQGMAGRLMRDTAYYDSLRKDVASLRKTLADLREGRGATGELLATDTLWNDVNRGVESMIRTVDRVNADPMFATHEVYDNLNGAAQELAGTLRDFRRSPKKYLRLKVF